MTPCEELGYKVGDKFKVVCSDDGNFSKNTIVYLVQDDCTECPRFSKLPLTNEAYDEDDWGYLFLYDVEKVDILDCTKSSATSTKDMLSTFQQFESSLRKANDVGLSFRKGTYTIYFDNYEFKGDESKIRKTIELLTELFIEGE